MALMQRCRKRNYPMSISNNINVYYEHSLLVYLTHDHGIFGFFGITTSSFEHL